MEKEGMSSVSPEVKGFTRYIHERMKTWKSCPTTREKDLTGRGEDGLIKDKQEFWGDSLL